MPEINIEQHIRDGSQMFAQGDLEKAKDYFEQAFKSAKLHCDEFTERACAFNLGAVYVALKQPEQGIAMLTKAVPPMNKRDGKSNGDLYYNFGLGYEQLNNNAEAVKYFELAFDEYQFEKDNIQMENEAAIKAAVLYVKLGSNYYLQAARCYGIAAVGLATARKITEQGLCLCKQATCLVQCGRFHEALQAAGDCMLLTQRIDNQQILGQICGDLGLVYSQCSDFPDAAVCFEQALSVVAAGDKQRKAILLQNLGVVYNSLTDYAHALSFHERASALYAELRDRRGQAECFLSLAFAYTQLADKDSAHECYLHALQAGRDTGDRQMQWQAMEGLGAVAFHNEQYDRAASYFKQALSTLAASGKEDTVSQERLVVKLTDVLQRQLAKHTHISPKNVRPPSVISAASVPVQSATVRPQSAAPNRELLRPPSRAERRRMLQQRRTLMLKRQREIWMNPVALGLSEYDTEDDTSFRDDLELGPITPMSSRSGLPVSARPASARPASSRLGLMGAALPAMGPIRPEAAEVSSQPPAPSMVPVVEEEGSPPATAVRAAKRTAGAAEAAEERTDSIRRALPKYNTGRRMSRQANHIHGVEYEYLTRRSQYSRTRGGMGLSAGLKRQFKKLIGVKTNKLSGEDENDDNLRPEGPENSDDNNSGDQPSSSPTGQSPGTSPERSATLKSTDVQHDEEGKRDISPGPPSNRDKVMSMLKGKRQQSLEATMVTEGPGRLGSYTRQISGPGTSRFSRQITTETSDSQQLDSIGTDQSDPLLERYTQRIRRESRNEEDARYEDSEDEDETNSSDESSVQGRAETWSEAGEERDGASEPGAGSAAHLLAAPTLPQHSPPHTMVNTYEQPVAYNASQALKREQRLSPANYFRAKREESEDSEEGSDDTESEGAPTSGPGQNLKTSLPDPNNPDYQTIASLRLDASRRAAGGSEGQNVCSNPGAAGPSSGDYSSQPPPLPPRSMADMSNGEQEEFLRRLHETEAEELQRLPSRKVKPKTKSRACTVM